jgi:hypothetical protein
MTEPPVTAPKRRRWLVHVIWLAVVVLAFWGGTQFGFQMYNATLGMMILDSDRVEKLGQIRASMRLLGNDDLSVHRNSEAVGLRASVAALTNMPRYAPCRPKDVDALIAAKTYLAAHPMAIEKEFGDIYADGLSYCDKPAEPYPYPYVIF